MFPSWAALPVELQQHVADFLDVRTRLALRCVNRAANELLVIGSLPIADIMRVGDDPLRAASFTRFLRLPACQPRSLTIAATSWVHIARSTRLAVKRGPLAELRATLDIPAAPNNARHIERMPVPHAVHAMVHQLATHAFDTLEHLALDLERSTLSPSPGLPGLPDLDLLAPIPGLPYNVLDLLDVPEPAFLGAPAAHDYDLGVLTQLPRLQSLSFKASRQRVCVSLPPLPVHTLELANVDADVPWTSLASLRHLAMQSVSFERRRFAVSPALATVDFRRMEDNHIRAIEGGRAARVGTGWHLSGVWHRGHVSAKNADILDISWLAPIYADTVEVAERSYTMSLIATNHIERVLDRMPRLRAVTFVITHRLDCVEYKAVAALQAAGIRPVLTCGPLRNDANNQTDE